MARRPMRDVYLPVVVTALESGVNVMFKFIGGAVVYGFALLGLARYLESRSEQE